MATETPRKKSVRPVFLIYGVFALLISLALAAFTFRGNLFQTGAQPTATSSPVILPTATTAPPTVTVGPGTPSPTFAPTATAAPTATITPAPTPAPGLSDTENPLGLPTPVLAAIFAFTTLSGIASILKFSFDSVVAIARIVGRFRRP
jgi:hypothetical protein